MSTTTSNLVLAIANVFVALGTLALAGVTAWMVRETRREVGLSIKLANSAEQQAEASQAQAEVAQASLLAAVQPILAEVPSDEATRIAAINSQMQLITGSADTSVNSDPARISVYRSSGPDGKGEVVRIRVPVRNVGHGPALITSARLTTVGGVNRQAEPMATIVGAGQRIEVPFVIQGTALGGFKLSRSDPYPDFSVEVEYTNAFGNEPRITILNARQITNPGGGTRCIIVGVVLRRPGDPTPIAESDFLRTSY